MSRRSPAPIGNHSEPLFPELAQTSGEGETNPRGPESPVRQEVLNVLVAQLLQERVHERAMIVAPERILKDPFAARRMPDVLVDYQGLRLVIEGEIASRGAKAKAGQSALRRVEEGIAHIGMALIYPAQLRNLGRNVVELKKTLAETILEFAVVTESEVTQAQLAFPEQPEKQMEFVRFNQGDLNALVDELRRAYEQLLKDDVLERAAQALNNAIGVFLNSLNIQPATIKRFAEVLEIRELPKKKAKSGAEEERELSKLDPRQASAISRIAGLVLVNAMMFQEVLAQKDERVKNLDVFRKEEDLIGTLADHWKYILDEINYFPIFHLAHKLLISITSDVDAVKALRGLAEKARMVVGWRASLRHDLAGRLYHRLLSESEAKYLGACYTSVPASVLLLKVALETENWPNDWSDPEKLRNLRIADLACGTGTLLMAAADVVVDNHTRNCVKQGKEAQFDALHRVLMEDVLWGYDVLLSALHLTASTLMLRSSEVQIENTKLRCLPLGGSESKLGSIEFSLSRTIRATTLFSQAATQLTGKEARGLYWTTLDDLDLCVMNPPFTRSVGGNLLFGNLPEGEREAMQRKLKNEVNRQNLSASITAGLGSVFIALADKYLKKGGRVALVLPRALLSGVAWQKTRELFNKDYHLEWVMVSHEANHWNFSENTDLSEVLMIARKRSDAKPSERVNCLNLWEQPRNSIEALRVGRQLTENRPPDLLKGQGALDIVRGEEKVGEAVSLPWSLMRKGLWNFPCAFAQADLARSLLFLLEGKLYLPTRGIIRVKQKLKLRPLQEIGELGFDVRDMHDGFKLATSKTAYPAFWDHDASRMFTLKRDPNSFLSPLPEAKEGRPLREAVHLWKKAGRLLIVERLRLNTMRLTAILVSQKVLSNVWWTLVLKRGGAEGEKALALWLNSSLGILLLLGHREETQGPWVKFKKPVLGQMPVLDVEGIGVRVTTKLAEAFDQLADRALLPFSHMAEDPVRAAIDESVASALDLPDFGILRQLLAREPILCLSMGRLRYDIP